MINFLEVTLFSQLVVSRSSFFSNNSCFVQLFLQHCKLVTQLLVLLVNCWNLWHLAHVKLASCFQFEPFSLELVKCLFHSELDEKVSQEFISLFLGTGGARTVSLIIVYELEFFLGCGNECLVIIKIVDIVVCHAFCLDVFSCI